MYPWESHHDLFSSSNLHRLLGTGRTSRYPTCSFIQLPPVDCWTNGCILRTGKEQCSVINVWVYTHPLSIALQAWRTIFVTWDRFSRLRGRVASIQRNVSALFFLYIIINWSRPTTVSYSYSGIPRLRPFSHAPVYVCCRIGVIDFSILPLSSRRSKQFVLFCITIFWVSVFYHRKRFTSPTDSPHGGVLAYGRWHPYVFIVMCSQYTMIR